MAFIPNTENKPTVDHINRIRTDNRIENLRWATLMEQSTNRGKKFVHEDITFNVKCVETGVIYENSKFAAEWVINQGLTNSSNKGSVAEKIRFNARGNKGRNSAFGYHWEFITEEE
jgi:hypothetical protein